MAREDERLQRETELVLPPGVFAFVLDSTKGNINTYCGPIKQSLSNTDQLVVYNAGTSRFLQAANFGQAIQTNVTAPKGHYVILCNPARDGKHPEPGKAEMMPPGILKIGEVENLPGPQSFPLWPSQTAKVVRGHQLRSNQYLLVRVYDEETARTRWSQSIIKLAELPPSSDATVPAHPVLGIDPSTLFTGQLLIIVGTEVSFYVPPSGIEVLPESDGDEQSEARYIRDAVTLERLEYCVLLSESGEKRYVIGPKVVFPKPTEQFVVKEEMRKFRAYELTEISGLHVKVIADYQESDGSWHRPGDELFITGKTQSIYYPRPEHAIISYGDRQMYFAIAIPSGEARYVLDRQGGEIRLVRGPAVFLPNPITEVVVKRVLTDQECTMYYPGNDVILSYNQILRLQSGARPADGGGVRGGVEVLESGPQERVPRSPPPPKREGTGRSFFGDSVQRGQSHTPPRSIVLDTKYEGAVTVDIWSGYAVQVVDRKGHRQVVSGPQTLILEYDQILERMTLSTGIPKSAERPLHTVYLRIRSNAISDVVSVKTRDLVQLTIQVKYLVRFEGDQQDWFNIDNYVQYLCDHLRSLIGNHVRGIGVLDFYFTAATTLRDLVLGARDADGNRLLRHFNENGMVVYDLELIQLLIADPKINDLIHQSQQEHLLNTVELERQRRLLLLTAGQEEAKREIAKERAETVELTHRHQLEASESQARLELALVQYQAQREQTKVEKTLSIQEVASRVEALRLTDSRNQRELDQVMAQAEMERTIQGWWAEAMSSVERMSALQPGLVEALTALAATGALQSMAQHLAPLSLVRDQSLAGTLEQIFHGTPLSGMLENLRRIGKGGMLEGSASSSPDGGDQA